MPRRESCHQRDRLGLLADVPGSPEKCCEGKTHNEIVCVNAVFEGSEPARFAGTEEATLQLILQMMEGRMGNLGQIVEEIRIIHSSAVK